MQCRGRVEDGADAEHGSSRRSARVNWNASDPAARDNAKEVLETRLSCLSRGTAIIHES